MDNKVLKHVLKEASRAGLLTLFLAFPILTWRTVQDLNNRLILEPQWQYALYLAAFIFFVQLLLSLRKHSPNFFTFWGPNSWTSNSWAKRLRLRDILLRTPTDQEAEAADFAPEENILHPSYAAIFLEKYRRPLLILSICLLAALPLLLLAYFGPLGARKWIDNYGIQILIYVMLGWGLNIVVGLAGLLDLGYVAFYAVGAYSYALLSTHFGLSFWICLPLSGLLAASWGAMLGFPVLRLRGDYLAIVTLAFGEIIRCVLVNWTDFSNGDAGISSIPKITFFSLPFSASAQPSFSSFFGLEYSPIHSMIFLFYLVLVLALLTNFVTLRLRQLPVGRAWEALREDEIACRSLGINTTNTKLTAFTIGAMFAGFAGSFFAVRQSFINPQSFIFSESVMIIAIVVLGGMGSQLGVAFAAILMIGGMEALREFEWTKQIFGPDFVPEQYRMLVFGLAMVGMMLWKPRGLISTRRPSMFLNEKKTIAGHFVGEGRS